MSDPAAVATADADTLGQSTIVDTKSSATDLVTEADRSTEALIVESIRNGQFLKCTAVHVATGREATAVGPAHEPKAVERLAVAKLKRLLVA